MVNKEKNLYEKFNIVMYKLYLETLKFLINKSKLKDQRMIQSEQIATSAAQWWAMKADITELEEYNTFHEYLRIYILRCLATAYDELYFSSLYGRPVEQEFYKIYLAAGINNILPMAAMTITRKEVVVNIRNTREVIFSVEQVTNGKQLNKVN